jgi:hypothetical protein
MAMSSRPACRDESMQAERTAVQALNESGAGSSAESRAELPRRPRRGERSDIRTTPLHRLTPLPGGRYFGQQ